MLNLHGQDLIFTWGQMLGQEKIQSTKIQQCNNVPQNCLPVLKYQRNVGLAVELFGEAYVQHILPSILWTICCQQPAVNFQ